jgi:peptidoglycan/xylan/chitin deacetylase (PgdA/CDA1 family)
MRRVIRFMQRAVRPRSSPVILMYHRVAEPACDPWNLAVSLDNFDQQMQVLRRNRRPLAMRQFVEGLRVGDLPERAVAVTFDDGYVDNLVNAKPRLERHGIPATVFLATGAIGRPHEYWWDELARLILLSEAQIDAAILICGDQVPIMLHPRDASPEACHSWRASEPPGSDREDLYLSIWRRLRLLAPMDREDVMQQLRILLKARLPHPRDFPMTAEDVRALADGGTISIGAHTVTHPLFSTLSPEERWQEIQQSKNDCEALTGIPVEGFAYPYGDCDAATEKLVCEAGFGWACSARSDRVDFAGFDPFDLPRLQVLNWNAEEFEKRLSLI